ncbi:MAG: methyl-accepting chemotaxis protein [Deltaproteobacteria bacterium]|nr:methyl-accepting chemotaxis protein [Deltaproteobacteria bacterium]
MGNQMTLAKRIAIGFAIVIAIALILGAVSIKTMLTAKENSTKLALEYVPEVRIANALRGASNRVMYQMLGYGMSEEPKYLENARQEMKAVETHLQEAGALADRSVHLKALKGQVGEAREAVTAYDKLIQQTEATIAAMNACRQKLDDNATSYMNNCNAFLMDQNEAFKSDLRSRQDKISTATRIVNLGTKVRVMNFKAQANGDAAMMEAAIRELDGLKDHTGSLRANTKRKDNLDQLAAIEKAGANYGQAMRGYLQSDNQGRGNPDAMTRIKAQMDESAGNYVENCRAYLESQQEQLTKDMFEHNLKINLVNDIIDLGNDARVKAFKSQTMRDPEIIRDALQNFPKLDQKYEELRKITRNDVNLRQIDVTQNSGKAYAAALSTFLEEWTKLQNIGAQRTEAGNKVIAACKKTADAGMKTTEEIANEAMISLTRSSMIMAVGLLIGMIIAIVAALLITRSINTLLKRVINGLSSGSDQVAAAAGQVSSASQSLAEGSSQQAASLEESSASVEEMASMTKQNADNAEQADILTKETITSVKAASVAMNNLNQSTEEIFNASQETQKIVKSIDEIAFQTNLLALNAAVEAARAGEAGAGFAVVADEVRNLAARSAEAAKSTAELIGTTVEKVSKSREVATQTLTAINEVVEKSDKVGSLVGEITAASQEQSNGIAQINIAVSEMDKVTQQNAANAEESAAAAEELNAQAEQMRDLVADLSALVTGSRETNHHLSPPRALGRTGGGRKVTKAKAALPKPKAKTKAKSSSKAEELIPLDDSDHGTDDFDGF